MSGGVGRLDEFDPKTARWTTYKMRLESWLRANKVTQAQPKLDCFIALVGCKTVELLVSLCTPEVITDKSYDELIAKLDGYYDSSVNSVNESVKFDLRMQQEHESVNEYIVAISDLSINCGFGNGDALFNRLRNRLITGVRDGGIREALLKEASNTENFTWDKAKKLAVSMDNIHLYPGRSGIGTSTNVNKVHSSNSKARQHTSSSSNNHTAAAKQASKQSCYRCKGDHDPKRCKFKNSKCHFCSKVGHIKIACRKMERMSSVGEVTSTENSPVENLYTVKDNMKSSSKPAYCTTVNVSGVPVNFTIDTGCGVTLIDETIYKSRFSDTQLQTCSTTLRAFSGHEIETIGQFNADIEHNGQSVENLRVIVVKGSRPSLLGREWLSAIRLNWSEIICNVNPDTSNDVTRLLEKHSNVFASGFGKIKGHTATITLKSDAKPRHHKARSVPYALRDIVANEIRSQVDSGILKPVEHSDWASPIVVVPKSTGKVRICADYKVSLNRQIEDHTYVLPTIEDILSQLKGDKFSKIDLASAFLQLPVDESSQKVLTITTQQGLFQPTTLPLGVKTSPLIFQQVMDTILRGLDGCVCYVDDILITADDDVKHLRLLDQVLGRLAKHGIHANKAKCSFLQEDIEYLGYKISKTGVSPIPDRVCAVIKAPNPSSREQLKTFLGMVSYYAKFIPNRSHILAPLYRLLHDGVDWKWSSDCERAVQKVKSLLTSDQTLIHYDSRKELVLACDASPYGVGCVLSHIVDGIERPIAYASKTLTHAEAKYPQIEREALGIVFGVQRFQKYLYGKRFKLVTDHKPLTAIFGDQKGVPALAAMRLQRWAVLLGAYDYEIVYKRSEENSNADYLSRFSVGKVDSVHSVESVENCYSVLCDLPLNYKDIALSTKSDPVLARVLDFIMNGWPETVNDDLKVYQRRKLELTCEDGCILWGSRVVIPSKHRAQALEELHSQHFGIVRTKSLARSYLWFPGIDLAIEGMVKSCSTCQTVQHDPTPTVRPWIYPDMPWYRVHADLATYKSKNYLILVDSHSKWPEAIELSSTNSASLIIELQRVFSTHGFPAVFVTDNGPQFVSKEFEEYLRKNGIRHCLSPYYHAASNGQAERTVQTIKGFLKKLTADNRDVREQVSDYLLAYRNTTHPLTNRSPAELLMKRQLRTRLSLVKPSKTLEIQASQTEQVRDNQRDFKPSQTVRVKSNNGLYEIGKVVKALGRNRFLVRVRGRIRYTHIDHLQRTEEVFE